MESIEMDQLPNVWRPGVGKPVLKWSVSEGTSVERSWS